MSEFRVGYLYSLAPLHPGGEGDLGNILDIVREVHTNFPYVPGSSLRGCLRDEVKYSASKAISEAIANNLFGKELDTGTGTMGVHQVWFGDARLLWIPMRTMAEGNDPQTSKDAFTWVSCPTLLRDHALVSRKAVPHFPQYPVGTRSGTYWVADSQIQVESMTSELKQAIDLSVWAESLTGEVKTIWETNRIVLPDSVFEILMEHALWTQIRNKITDNLQTEDDIESSGTEAFWTDICIPRDTILYFSWGYRKDKTVLESDHNSLKQVLQGLFQVGGQANVGRGWVQGWIANHEPPANLAQEPQNPQANANPEHGEPIGV